MPASKTIHPVGHSTLVLQVQAEYNAATQTVVLRCRLETPATGQHRGFSDLPALLTAIEADLLALQQRLLVAEQEQES